MSFPHVERSHLQDCNQTVCKKSDMTTETLDDLVLAFSWSMHVLLSGQAPHQDWKGNPLEGGGIDLAFGFRATLCQVRGDLGVPSATVSLQPLG